MKTLKNIKRHKLQESQNLKREIKKYTFNILPVALHKYSKKVVNVKGFRAAVICNWNVFISTETFTKNNYKFQVLIYNLFLQEPVK